MAIGIAGVGAIVSAGASIYSSKKAGDAADKSARTANLEYVRDAQRYDEAKKWLGDQGALGQSEIDQSRLYGEQGMEYAQQQSNAFQEMSQTYGAKGEGAEAAMGAYFDEFLQGFEGMLAENEGALQDFNRRYGPIMDNVAQGIQNVSAASLSAQGREQLSLDVETLGKNFQASMANRNMGRSGINVEAEQRMAMETAQQARAIDVNSHQQSMQLQGQGIQNLNSMQSQQQFLQNQRLGIMGSQGQANQQVGQAYGNMAQNYYGAQQNMFGRGFGAVNNANVNLANQYGNIGGQRVNNETSFYTGMQPANANNMINSYNNQANNYQADAGGYMQAAGTFLGNTDWGNFGKTGAPNAPTTQEGTK